MRDTKTIGNNKKDFAYKAKAKRNGNGNTATRKSDTAKGRDEVKAWL